MFDTALNTALDQKKIKTQSTQLAQVAQPVQPVQPAQPTKSAQPAQSAQPTKFAILTKKKTKLISEDDVEIKETLPIKQITQITQKQSPGTEPANFINCTNEIELKTYTYFNEPMKCKEFNTINSVLCSYQLILEIINNNSTTTVSLKNIINNLIKKYNELFENNTYKQKILSLWNNEGKEDISNKLANKIVNIDDIITENTYLITTTDIMLLADIYKIPIVLFSEEEFNEFNSKVEILNIYFLMNKEKNIKILTVRTKTVKPTISSNKKYYYIQVSKNDGNLYYKLFYNNLDEFKLSETMIASDFINAINISNSYINKILA
jgi:hypothetical protein